MANTKNIQVENCHDEDDDDKDLNGDDEVELADEPPLKLQVLRHVRIQAGQHPSLHVPSFPSLWFIWIEKGREKEKDRSSERGVVV